MVSYTLPTRTTSLRGRSAEVAGGATRALGGLSFDRVVREKKGCSQSVGQPFLV
ncbi:hypothetical protein [Brevibacillus antibioticus]|uniref:hypothetical protein n=1 Tax=Brevibacillus antibioticus TaxID=2570228 RepID=UPI00138FB639